MRPPYWKEMNLSLSVSAFLYIGVLWGPMGFVCLGYGIDEASLLEGDEFELVGHVGKCIQGYIKNF